MKTIKRVLIFALFVFLGMQFYRPYKNINTTDHTAVFISETNPSKEVRLILKNACYDCHTNNTNYPWYNNVAPISYWLSHHIDEGKEHLNFSDWEKYTTKKKAHKLEELVEEVEEGKMPLNEYTWTHASAKLSTQEKEAIMAWAKQTRVLYQLGNLPK